MSERPILRAKRTSNYAFDFDREASNGVVIETQPGMPAPPRITALIGAAGGGSSN